MKPIKYSLTKQIAAVIEEKILSNEFQVGDKIPAEPELIHYFGVSRNTIRESVQALIHAGLLEARQGDGTYVIAKERLQVDLFSLMQKNTKQDIKEVRNLLEEHIVATCCVDGTKEDFLNIESCLKARTATLENRKENTQADIDFHLAICNATHNNLLITIYNYVSQYFNQHILESLTIHQDNQDYIDNLHHQLFEEIKNRNINKAKENIIKIINL